MAQGASLAFEDALVLASELSGHAIESIDVALVRYAQRRELVAHRGGLLHVSSTWEAALGVAYERDVDAFDRVTGEF